MILFFIVSIVLVFIVCKSWFIFLEEREFSERVVSLENRHVEMEAKERRLRQRFLKLEARVSETFFTYELARKISSIMDKDRLLKAFKEEILAWSSIKDVHFLREPGKGHFNFELRAIPPVFLSIKTGRDHSVMDFGVIVKMLNLCLEKINLYEKLEKISIHDNLTGIYNRRYFNGRFYEEFGRSEKFKLKLSVLMIDIDNFKKINDTYGHLVGDRVLREVSKMITHNLREIDFVARYGGEEFVVILLETDKSGALFVGERIRKEIEAKKIRAFDETLSVTVSVGVATYPNNARSSGIFLEVADKALYSAKNKGKNRVETF